MQRFSRVGHLAAPDEQAQPDQDAEDEQQTDRAEGGDRTGQPALDDGRGPTTGSSAPAPSSTRISHQP